MNITPLTQTKKMNCGQTAVAMLTGKSIKEVEAIYGHGTITYTHEHVFNLTKMGFLGVDSPGFVQRGTPGFAIPETGLVRIAFLKKSGGHYSTTGKTKRTGHLVVIAHGIVYDPAGRIYPLSALPADRIVDKVLSVPMCPSECKSVVVG